LRAPPHIHPSEQRCTDHFGDDDDIEALVIAARETELDRAYREHLAARTATNENNTDTNGQPIIRRSLAQVLGGR
jgi:hypothetical protein